MTKEEAKEIFLNRGYIDGIYDGNKWREACIVISEWLEQEPATKNDLGVDCISREDVLQTLLDYDYANENALVIQDIKALPTVTPQEPVLDKIRTEIHATAEMHEDGDYYLRDEWIDEIFDKYKAESEDNNG